MTQDNVIDLKKPESFIDDPITDILRQGTRRLLTAALEGLCCMTRVGSQSPPLTTTFSQPDTIEGDPIRASDSTPRNAR